MLVNDELDMELEWGREACWIVMDRCIIKFNVREEKSDNNLKILGCSIMNPRLIHTDIRREKFWEVKLSHFITGMKKLDNW